MAGLPFIPRVPSSSEAAEKWTLPLFSGISAALPPDTKGLRVCGESMPKRGYLGFHVTRPPTDFLKVRGKYLCIAENLDPTRRAQGCSCYTLKPCVYTSWQSPTCRQLPWPLVALAFSLSIVPARKLIQKKPSVPRM